MAKKSEFQQLTRALGLRQGGLVLVLTAYFDDSGTHTSSDVVVWGGFIGTDEQWAAFDDKWRAKLARPFDRPEYTKPRLAKFHLADCHALKGEFRDYTRTESDSIQHDFRQIISEAGVIGVSYAIDRNAYDKLVTDPDAREFLGDAEQVCFGACFKGAFQKAQQHYPQEEKLLLVFDYVNDAKRVEKMKAFADRFDQLPESRPQIVSVGLAKVIETTPLQAADILATENYWDARAWLADENRISRPHFRHFLNNIDCEGLIMREREIRHYMWKYGYGADAAGR